VIDAAYLPLLPELNGITYASYDEVLTHRGDGDADPTSFRLVQYTSGSTSDPRGVVLDQSQILANIRSIIERLQPAPGDSACSWLPLSHDMGLIGMLLSAIVGANTHTNGGDYALMTPEGFLRNPGRWLQVCSEYQSTITAAPNFGFEMALRRQINGPLDLSALRVCITGAEPVNAASLQRFADTFVPMGFANKAHCPAYGLAEATLAVAMSDPDDLWSGLPVDPDELLEGKVKIDPEGMSVVGAGYALENMEVKIDALSEEIGEIVIRGASVLRAYSDGSLATDGDGWFRTSDLGFFRDEELYVVGRRDDVLFAAGRKVFAVDVERHVGELPGVRVGRVVALTTPADGITVLVEADEVAADPSGSFSQLAEAVRQRVTSRTGVAPRAVGVVKRGHLPMTASGKNRRRETQASLGHERLEILRGSIGFDQ
jgi:acyl-CoA synthetase (AMP-forming)/AMP-acid ligase II